MSHRLWSGLMIGLVFAGSCLAAPFAHLHKRPPASPMTLAATAQDSIHVGSLTLHRCSASAGYCGPVLRALDPTAQVPGNIQIHFEFYPHTDVSQPALEPIMAAEGGPGYSTTGSRDGYIGLFTPLMDRRDLLLIDERGTGTSEAVDCPILQGVENSSYSSIRECGLQLGDARYLYGSGLAADDVAAILDTLGIDKIDLYGDSYGTYFSQTFAGRHPERLRSVVLDSAYPVRGLSPWYPEIAPTVSFAFNAACARSPACSSLPGTSMGRIGQLIASLRVHPFSGKAPDGDGILGTVKADATNLDYLMVGNATQSTVYRELDPAARAYLEDGDAAPLLRLLAENQGNATSGGSGNVREFSEAMFVAVSCQDYPQIYDMTSLLLARFPQRRQSLTNEQQDDPDVYAPFTIPEFDRIPLDTSVLDLVPGLGSSSAVTPAYPPGEPVPADAEFTKAPVLVMSGDLDSLTPALQGKEAADLFENGRQVIVANSFHVTAVGDEDNCASGIVQRFVQTLDPGDTSCTSKVVEVHLVPKFATRAQDVDPATAGHGNQGTDADLRIAAATAYTVGDVLARWWVNFSGVDKGLRGGRFSYTSPSNLTFFTLDKLRWVNDVQVSGKVRWDYDYPGAVVAHVHIEGDATQAGDLIISWKSHVPLSQARITRKNWRPFDRCDDVPAP